MAHGVDNSFEDAHPTNTRPSVFDHAGDALDLLNRKLLRDMRSHKSQVVAVLVIVTLGTAILTTLLIVPRALDGRVNYIFSRTSHEDFSSRGPRHAPGAVTPLGSAGNVKAVQATIEKRDVGLGQRQGAHASRGVAARPRQAGHEQRDDGVCAPTPGPAPMGSWPNIWAWPGSST